jgi:hypothetical protein
MWQSDTYGGKRKSLGLCGMRREIPSGPEAFMNITICPPSPQLEKFDQFQFVSLHKQKNWAVSADTRIAYSDYERMSTVAAHIPRRTARRIPAFASDMQKLRAVILEAERLRANNKLEEQHTPEAKEHCRLVAKAGSYRALIAAVAYHSWLERLDSVAVSELMGMKPVAVRQHLFRLNLVARRLGFETFEKKKQRPAKSPLRWLERRRCTIRRRLYGSPEYREDFHCFACRVAPIDKSTNKWRCARCLEDCRAIQRKQRRALRSA